MFRCVLALLLFPAYLFSQPVTPQNLRITGTEVPSFSGDFSGNAQSLAPYRNNLSEAEIRHFLTHAAFGGTPEEVSYTANSRLQAIVNRFLDGPASANTIRDYASGDFRALMKRIDASLVNR